MLDMRFFQNPRFTAANSAITLTFFAMFGSMFLMTQYWQFVHGYSPLGAGLRMIPYALTMMVVAPLSARVVERLGTKRVVTMGLLIISTALLALSFIGATTAYPIVITMFCVMAAGMGMTMAPATESVMGSLPREKAGVGSAVNDTTRQMGGALGVAVIGSVVSSVYAGHISDLAERFGLTGGDLTMARGSLGGALEVGSGLGAEAGTFVAEVKDGFVDALSNGLRLSSVVILGAAFVAWRFLPARAHDPLARDVVDQATADTAPSASPWVEAERWPPVPPRSIRRRSRPSAVGRAAPMPTRRSSRRRSSCSPTPAWRDCRWTSSPIGPGSARRRSTAAGPPRSPSCWTPCGRPTGRSRSRTREPSAATCSPTPKPSSSASASGRASDVLPHLIEASCYDDQLRRALDEYLTSRQATIRLIIGRGIERGELAADTDVDVVVDLVLGPFYYRHLLTGAPVDRDFAHRVVDVALR